MFPSSKVPQAVKKPVLSAHLGKSYLDGRILGSGLTQYIQKPEKQPSSIITWPKIFQEGSGFKHFCPESLNSSWHLGDPELLGSTQKQQSSSLLECCLARKWYKSLLLGHDLSLGVGTTHSKKNLGLSKYKANFKSSL